METDLLTVVEQLAAGFVSVSVISPVPIFPQLTVIWFVPAPEPMVPPLTVQA
jgi:hypothetical protein